MRPVFFVLLLLVLAATGGAQQPGSLPSEVQPGARVRARAPGVGTATGRVLAGPGDSLYVARARPVDTVRLATNQLTSLDLSLGQHKRRWRGAALGFLGGAVLGAAVGVATYQKPKSCGGELFCDLGPGYDAAFGALLLGIVGTATGAILGAGTADDWKALPLGSRASLDLRAPPSAGALALGASLRF